MTEEIKIGDEISYRSRLFDMFPGGVASGVVEMLDADAVVVRSGGKLAVVAREDIFTDEDRQSEDDARDVGVIRERLQVLRALDDVNRLPLPEVRALAKAIREQKA